MNLEEERDALRRQLQEARVALEMAQAGREDPDWTCGWRGPGQPACNDHARWYGSFLIGAWISMVPLCEEHARTWHAMQRAYDLAMKSSGGGVASVQIPVRLIEEILSLRDNTPYSEVRSRLVWNCAECGQSIVRSLETGEWITVGEVGIVKATIAQHEHRPG